MMRFSMYAAAVALAMPSSAPAEVPVVPEGVAFVCTPTAVWDGDGPIWCEEGPHIRLNGIAAREIDGSCRPGHPCPSASAEAARDHLVELLGRRTGVGRHGHILVEGPELHCISVGNAVGNRTGASCVSAEHGDIARRMACDGFAARWDRYDPDGTLICEGEDE